MADQFINPEMQDITRQRELAKALMQQGFQQNNLQGQMIGNRYVGASPLQGLANLANLYVGKSMAEESDKKQQELLYKQQEAMQSNIAKALQTMKGTPAKEATFDYGNNEADQIATMTAPATQAVAGNKELAIAQLLRPNASALEQQVAGKLLEGQFKEPKWEKAELTDPRSGATKQGWVDLNSPNPELTFRQGGEKPAISPIDVMKGRFEGWYTGSPTGGVVGTPTGLPSGTPTGTPLGKPQQFSPQSAISMPNMSPQAAIQANKEVYVDKAKRQAEYAEKAPAAIQMMNQTINNINDLIGDTKVVDNKLVYGTKAPHPGFENSVGLSSGPLARFIPGSSTMDFRARFDQLGGQAFLQAFDTLKGAGQITEVEGAKATQALNRMNLAQSEVEFVKAAREFEDQVNKGIELARKRAGIQTPNTGWRLKNGG